MPSAAHEVLVAVLGNEPSILALLVHKLVGGKLALPLMKVDSTVRFADPEEIRPDVVLRGDAQPWLIVEVQGEEDGGKARRWPLAAAALLDQTGAMGDVVVITQRPRVARWARRVAHSKGPLGTQLMLRPIVLLIAGPALEALLDKQHPELALVAAWAMQHRHGPRARELVTQAIALSDTLPEPLRGAALRAIYNVLSEPMREFLKEAAMDPEKIPESPSARETREAIEGVLKRAEARGECVGEARGAARGEARAKARAVLTVLEARSLPISDEQRARVLTCEDPDQLDRWLRRAATAASADDALG